MADDLWSNIKRHLIIRKHVEPKEVEGKIRYGRVYNTMNTKNKAKYTEPYDLKTPKKPVLHWTLKVNGPVSGTVVRVETNGYGVVKLDNGSEAYFDRFGVSGRSIKRRGKLVEGARIVGEAESVENGIAKLRAVTQV